MARFGLVGPDYASQSPLADAEMTMNMFLEQIEAQGKSKAALYCTPGLRKIASLTNGQGRGIAIAQGRTFAVCGTQLWEGSPPLANLTLKNWTASTGIQIASDGRPVCMAAGPTQLLIASAGNLYVFDLEDDTLVQVKPGDGLLGAVIQVRYLLGFFYAQEVDANGRTLIQQSEALDGSLWDQLAQTQVLDFSDNIVGIFEDHLTLWVFGPKKIVPYVNTGASPFALEPQQGGIIEQGLAAPNSVAQIDNSVFWLGSDTRGQGIVWRLNGYTPQRISTFALENELNSCATIADANCYAYQEAGHTFYVMNFPTANTTRVYDCASGTWHRRGRLNPLTGSMDMWGAGFHTFGYGLHIVLDSSNGNVYEQSVKYLDDAGAVLKRIRRSPHIADEGNWLFHDKLQIDVETGLGPNILGRAAPTVIPILDVAGNLRGFGVNDNGIIDAQLDTVGDPLLATTLIFTAVNTSTSWQVTVSAVGVISLVSVPFLDSYQQSMSFITRQTDERWIVQVTDLMNGFAELQANSIGKVVSGPIVVLRWSNDGGHSWSNDRQLNAGQQGNYIARVIAYRLGRARDRIYEISMTDPCAWRIVDGYLQVHQEESKSA